VDLLGEDGQVVLLVKDRYDERDLGHSRYLSRAPAKLGAPCREGRPGRPFDVTQPYRE
jgi:hypothetical protein